MNTVERIQEAQMEQMRRALPMGPILSLNEFIVVAGGWRTRLTHERELTMEMERRLTKAAIATEKAMSELRFGCS